jgi:hypothetical protein
MDIVILALFWTSVGEPGLTLATSKPIRRALARVNLLGSFYVSDC